MKKLRIINYNNVYLIFGYGSFFNKEKGNIRRTHLKLEK